MFSEEEINEIMKQEAEDKVWLDTLAMEEVEKEEMLRDIDPQAYYESLPDEAIPYCVPVWYLWGRNYD